MANDQVRLVRLAGPVSEYGDYDFPLQYWYGTYSEYLDLPAGLVIQDYDCQKKTRKQDPAGSDGSRRDGQFWGERQVEVGGKVKDASKEELQELQWAITAFMTEPNVAILWNTKIIRVTSNSFQWQVVPHTGGEIAQVRISFYCQDPYWYHATVTARDWGEYVDEQETANITMADSAGDLPYFSKYPLIKITTNTGELILAGAKIRIGEIESVAGSQLRNLILTIPYDINPGEVVIINMATGECQHREGLEDGDELIRDFTANMAGEVWPLAPGTSYVRITIDQPADSEIQIDAEYRQRWI